MNAFHPLNFLGNATLVGLRSDPNRKPNTPLTRGDLNEIQINLRGDMFFDRFTKIFGGSTTQNHPLYLEATEFAQKNFNAIDTNRDGGLSEAERTTYVRNNPIK